MKLSKFNIEKNVDNGTILYNTMSGGVLFLNSEYSDSYRKIKKTGYCEREDLTKELRKGEMLLNDGVNEVGRIKILSNMTRLDTHGLSLTIAPTMECNFACPYCFEEGVRYNKMTPIVEEQVINFIKESNKEENPLSICWYGGEPLMGIKNIENITREIMKNEKIVENYSASIITNGFYLNRKTALLLSELRINTAQITLDGPPDIHNTRRVPLNGRPTFDIIMKNIIECCDILNISIRVNVDRTNINRVSEMLDILEKNGLKNKVGFYIAAVDDSASSKPNADCFNDKEFSEEELSFYIEGLKRGFNLISVPGQNLGVCGAISLNSFVIDPLGNLYKCWNEIGRIEACVGNVVDGMEYNKKLSDYLQFEPVIDEDCEACPVLPSCMGGCLYITMNVEKRCNSIKYNAEKIVDLIYTKKMSEVSAKV
jgi:uncharacterized protein